MTRIFFVSLLTGGLFATSSALAADIKVLTAGAYKSVIVALQPEFERQSGHRLIVANATAGELTKRIGAGEQFDVVVIPPRNLDAFIESGQIAAGSKSILAQVGIGVMVRDGDPAPDISTVDAFKAALLDAPTVAYIDPASGGSSGVYLTGLFEKLGITSQIQSKSKLKNGGYVADLLVDRQADFGLHQISEILPIEGVTLVGPLPDEIQNYTVYAGGVSASSENVEAASSLLSLLRSEKADAVLEERGMGKPEV